MSQIDMSDTDTTSIFIPFQSILASTHQSKYFVINADAAVAESSAQAQAIIEELEWHKIVSNPHVRSELRCLAAKTLQEFAAGETEEGGFAVE